MDKLQKLEWIVIAILIIDILDVGFRLLEKFL